MAEFQVLDMKTGSSAALHMAYTDDQDPAQPQSLLDYGIYVDFINLRTRVSLFRASVGEGVEILDEEGGLYSVDPGDTSEWPLGDMQVDIKYVYGGATRNTDTFILRFTQGITQ